MSHWPTARKLGLHSRLLLSRVPGTSRLCKEALLSDMLTREGLDEDLHGREASRDWEGPAAERAGGVSRAASQQCQ